MSGSMLALLALGGCGGAVALLLFRASPRLTFVTWALTLYFVPVWVGASVGFFWSAITLVTLLALAANVGNLRLVPADGLVLLFVTLTLALFTLNMATLSATVIALLEWCLPYIWGRIVLSRLGAEFLTRVIATLAIVAATLAVIEFLSGSNLFASVPAMSSDLYAEWGSAQLRADRLRAEGAWGHSIALGAALSMSSSFILRVRWPNLAKFVGLALVVAGTVVTLSRIGLVTIGLTITLSLVFLPQVDRRLRIAVASMGTLAGLAVVPFVSSVFSEAGEEAAGSADYRGQLFSLAAQIRLLGEAGDWASQVVDDVYLGTFSKSIDNAVLLFGLRFGWIPTLLLVLILVMAAACALRRSTSSPAAIAVAAQVPTLFAVALITQFGIYLWFLAGLALSWQSMAPNEERPELPRLRGVSARVRAGSPATGSITGRAAELHP